MSKRNKKSNKRIRTEFRKRHDERSRKKDFTREFRHDMDAVQEMGSSERVSGKGRLTRKRTVVGSVNPDDPAGFQVELDIDPDRCLSGRVIQVFGLNSIVRIENGDEYRCTIRGVLKSMATDLQHVVVAGDFVTIETIDSDTDEQQAVIVRVDPRNNQISRTSRKKQQVIASNIDQALIVASAAEPHLKPNLIDRFLISAQYSRLQPIIVINKIDLVHAADLQPVAGVWGQLGYPVLLVSAITGQGVDRLQRVVSGRDSVVTGQSGVGKSSLLNAIEPGLELRVGDVSDENQKGTHTTTSAQLIPLAAGGHLIDTPGIRQFELWDVIPDELAGYFPDIRPFINDCRFPDCTHTHEDECAVKWAVADGKIDVRRYESYCQMRDE